jgi:hypothetical protein
MTPEFRNEAMKWMSFFGDDDEGKRQFVTFASGSATWWMTPDFRNKAMNWANIMISTDHQSKRIFARFMHFGASLVADKNHNGKLQKLWKWVGIEQFLRYIETKKNVIQNDAKFEELCKFYSEEPLQRQPNTDVDIFFEKYKPPKNSWLLEKLDVNQSSFAGSNLERQRSIVESIICEAENAGKLFWIRTEDKWQILSRQLVSSIIVKKMKETEITKARKKKREDILSVADRVQPNMEKDILCAKGNIHKKSKGISWLNKQIDASLTKHASAKVSKIAEIIFGVCKNESRKFVKMMDSNSWVCLPDSEAKRKIQKMINRKNTKSK